MAKASDYWTDEELEASVAAKLYKNGEARFQGDWGIY